MNGTISESKLITVIPLNSLPPNFSDVDNAAPKIKNTIQEQLMPAVISYYEAALKVKRLIPRIAMPDDLTYYCAKVYSNSALKSGVQADLVLLVLGLEEPDESYIAYASVCTTYTR